MKPVPRERPAWIDRLHERQRVRDAHLNAVLAHLNTLVMEGCTFQVMRPPRYMGQP